MKVLWFTATPSLYDRGKHAYHGGGWIESLEKHVSERRDIKLGVSFFHINDCTKIRRGQTTYYPIRRPSGRHRPIRQVLSNWQGTLLDDGFESQFMDIVNDFKPDVIQVFGTEGAFGRIQELTYIPVVIHLQGLINPYLNTYFPAGNSRLDFLADPLYFLKSITGSSPAIGIKRFKKQAERERLILGNARFVMGRTHWDHMLAMLYNPSVKYFHINEVLRQEFYEEKPTAKSSTTNILNIISILSPTTYKGIDVVLRVARELRRLNRINFCWQIAGITSDDILLKHFEKREGVSHCDLGIKCLGRQRPDELIAMLQQANIAVHPSYIDNSPNSVCEAQMLGVSVIACDVGGLKSLIQHGESGYLVPSNGVYELLHYLYLFAEDKELSVSLGKKAADVARRRHDPATIVDSLITAYNTMIGE